MKNIPCPQCSQIWNDSITGEYPCATCGMPMVHDQSVVAFAHESNSSETIAALRAELRAAQAREIALREEYAGYADTITEMSKELKAARAQVAALKHVLEGAPQIWDAFNEYSLCQWCHCNTENHAPDCARQAALGLDKKGGE